MKAVLSILALSAMLAVDVRAQDYVWVEAEGWDRGNFPSSTWLSPSDQSEQDLLANSNLLSSVTPSQSYWAEYDITIPSTGTYKVYARRDYSYGVFTWRFDSMAWQKAAGDLQQLDSEPYKQFFPMTWVQAGVTQLTAGAHTFRIEVKSSDWPDPPESGYLDKVAIDAFMFSKEAFIPRGKLRPDQKYGLAESGKWNFEPGPDPFATNAVLDLSTLNEDVAGQSGYVTRSGDKFLLGDGRPTRFWGVTTSVTGPDVDTVRAHARFLAKRGVNLVRFHTTVPAMDPSDINAIDEDKLAGIHRLIAGMKQEGIYVKLSWFFVLNSTIRGAWGIDGYTSDTGSPFAIHMFDEDMRVAYKEWISRILTATNSYTGLTLAEDPAVAIVELQNEDSFFFWTFSPSGWPTQQQAKIDGKFGDYLVDRYGSVANAVTAWGGAGSLTARDDQPAGRMTVSDAWNMTGGFTGSTQDQNRMAAQIEFLAGLQRDFYSEIGGHIRTNLGCQALLEACNWKTADVRVLQDVERYTYSVTDVIDAHHYFDTVHYDATAPDASSYSVQKDDYFMNRSVFDDPRALPAAYKQVVNRPSIVSENTWTHPNRYQTEGPLLVAAYSALQDIDGWIWFATGVVRYEDVVSKFPVAVPSLMGQFPGAALLYRRGDVTEAPVIIRDNRTLSDMFAKEKSLISETSGFDPNRDDPGDPVFDPGTGSGQIDPLAFLVGKVESAFQVTNTADVVDTNLFAYFDADARTVRSMPPAGSTNSEVTLDWTSRLFRIDTPRSQAAVGFFSPGATVDLQHVSIVCTNEYAAVLMTSLDDRTLDSSDRVLVQVATEHRPYGWQEQDAVFTEGSTTYTGRQITATGQAPMNVVDAFVTVRFRNTTATNARVAALDLNGYERGPGAGSFDGSDFVMSFPTDTLYAVVYFTRPDPDSDNDGLLDEWELRYFPSLTTTSGGPEEDWDKDGFPDRAEYTAGTNPTNPLSAFRVSAIEPSAGDDSWIIHWLSVTGRTYSIGWATNLLLTNAFTPLTSGLPAGVMGNAYTDSVHTIYPRVFYRLGVEQAEE